MSYKRSTREGVRTHSTLSGDIGISVYSSEDQIRGNMGASISKDVFRKNLTTHQFHITLNAW